MVSGDEKNQKRSSHSNLDVERDNNTDSTDSTESLLTRSSSPTLSAKS